MEFSKQPLTHTRDFLRMGSTTAKARQLGIRETFTRAITKKDKNTDMECILKLTEHVTKGTGFRGSVTVQEWR